MMTSAQIRQSFLDFFRSRQHTIVPSASLLPDSPNLLFTNAGMNQFVPIFLGRVECPYNPPRAADTQKCIRAGGKHNDLEDVGLDTYHHTFFEMLGNWSFGDYFKKEAIAWAWELLVDVWGFPPERLYATIYQPDPANGDPAERDEEAYDCWADRFRQAGLDPAVHIVDGGRKDNFWMMGDTGPCGPCTEIHINLLPDIDPARDRNLVNAGDSRCIEIWNNVFIQYNANPDGTFSPLPSRHVDTGMGFERAVSMIQGTRGLTDFRNARISNYETDVFRPLFDGIEALCGRKYGSTLPRPGSTGDTEQERVDVAFRVIADHIRTLSFAIADGIEPGNNERNYVLRRILRRAVRYGRTLGFTQPFFYRLTRVVADTMGDVFPEVRARESHIAEVLQREEEAFNRTLDKGIALFEAEAGPAGGTISGDFAFRLYDEQGFPLDLTELMARERGLTVDREGFEKRMEEQRERARRAQKKTVIELSQIGTKKPTEFQGYDLDHTEAEVQEVVTDQGRTVVIADRSVCYAAMGGQVGDSGEITSGDRQWRIADTQKSGETWLHFLEGADAPSPGDHVVIAYDRPRRAAIQRHHTVTHILHWAIHEIVSRDSTQKGSYVGAEKLTFDFNSAPLTPAQVADIERLVNERVIENAPVTWRETEYSEVKPRTDIMQAFGEKYGDRVRVVQIGGNAGALDGYSMELCGGTHVRSTGEIGLFRIAAESATGAGIRRIEAVAGIPAIDLAAAESSRLRQLAAKLNSPLPDLERRIELLLEQQKELEKALRAARQREASVRAGELAAAAAGGPVIADLGNNDADYAMAVADALKRIHGGIAVLAASGGGSVVLVASVPAGEQARIPAGRIIQTIAPLVGGKGGGRPDFARGGGRDASRIADALAEARRLVS